MSALPIDAAPPSPSPDATAPTPAERLPLWAWALLGIAVTAMVNMRFNVAVLAWVSAVPWLIFLRRTEGWKARVAFVGLLQVAMFLSLLKIITAPMPWFFALMFSVPMGIGSALAFLAFEAMRRRLGEAWGLALFPAMAIATDWLGAHGSEMGTWGAAAYTQLDNLALMQTVSLFGLSGVSGLIAMSSGLVAAALSTSQPGRYRVVALGTLGLVATAHAWGAWRLVQPPSGPMVTVATVVTDIAMGPDGSLPDDDAMAAATDALFVRSTTAADAGAQLVVWNEGALALDRDGEAALLRRAHRWSSQHHADLVMGYVVPLDGMARFENKYAWMTPDGLVEDYWKHHPVPSEGSVPGIDPYVAHDRPYGRAAGAICYDYDFPDVGQAHASLGIDLAVVPSSDWRGIDPIHSQMATVRGIEGGYAVVRSVRAATSMVSDAHGVVRGRASDLEGQRLLVASVPVRRVPTLYGRIGDVVPAGAGLVLLLGSLTLARRRFRGLRAA